MAAKLSALDLVAAAAELAPADRQAVVAALRRPDDAAEDAEAVAEITMGSAARMLDSSRSVLDRVLASAARVNDELARGWF